MSDLLVPGHVEDNRVSEKLIPRRDLILVQPGPRGSIKRGLIATQELLPTLGGVVIRLGPDTKDKDIKVGSVVAFNVSAGVIMFENNVEMRMMHDTEVLSLVELDGIESHD